MTNINQYELGSMQVSSPYPLTRQAIYELATSRTDGWGRPLRPEDHDNIITLIGAAKAAKMGLNDIVVLSGTIAEK